jgi:branched-chain amino acid transport system permease protein
VSTISPAVLAVTSTDVAQNTIAGLALGSKYALIALGFVVVFRATGVINFANGAFVLVGAYLTYNFSQTWGINFYLAILMSMAAGFVLGVVLETLVLGRLVGEAVFTVIMVTIGLLFIIDNLITAVWGAANLSLGDPWTGNIMQVGDLRVSHRDLWAMGFTAAVLVSFLGFFRYSNMGLAMRATAMDPEAAMAQGISARRVYRAAWGIAGLVAALAGTTFATGAGQLQPGLGLLALSAFPAMILGGMDSPLGAVIGGLVIGVVQQLTQLLAPEYMEWAGRSPELVVPYVVMVIILLVRPYGLFGTPEVRRV